MKKIFILVLMVLVGISLLFSNLRAEEARTITHKTRVVTVNTLIAANGVTVYSVNGYANANNAIYALVNQATLTATPASTAYKVEGGEGTQYDSIPTIDFGDDGIFFDTGLAVFTTGAYLVIEYD